MLLLFLLSHVNVVKKTLVPVHVMPTFVLHLHFPLRPLPRDPLTSSWLQWFGLTLPISTLLLARTCGGRGRCCSDRSWWHSTRHALLYMGVEQMLKACPASHPLYDDSWCVWEARSALLWRRRLSLGSSEAGIVRGLASGETEIALLRSEA